MKKRYIVVIIIVLILAILCLIPSPLNNAKAADGGTRRYSPILPVYTIVDWNKVEIVPHDDQNSSNGKTIKGKQIFIFGFSVYDGRYTVDGVHTR